MTLRSAAAVAALITSLSAGPLLGEERDSNTMNLMDDKNPPVAKVVPHPVTIHGDTRADDYFWIRDDKRQDPEVLGYLEAENNYTARVMKPTEAMQQRIFEEIKGRVKETDLTVPYLDNDYFYYSRTEAGKQYAIYCRKTRSLDAPEEIYCDQNEMAKGHDYFSLGVKNVSPNGQLMAFSTDTNGSESYRLQFRDLTTGKLYPEAMSEVDNVAWANDNRHLFYTTRDPAKRTYRVWRHELDTPAANDVLLYQEDDALYDIYLAKTRSDGFILFGSASSTTSECRVIPADQPLTAPRLVEPRQEDIEYYVDHRGDTFYIRTNQDAKNFKIVTAPVATPDASHWTELLAHRPAVKIEDIDIFQDFWVSVERSRGLGQLRVTSFREGISHDIEFPDAAYAVSPSGNAEFVTSAYRRADSGRFGNRWKCWAALTRPITSPSGSMPVPTTVPKFRLPLFPGRERPGTARPRFSCTATAPTAFPVRPAFRAPASACSIAASSGPSPTFVAAANWARSGMTRERPISSGTPLPTSSPPVSTWWPGASLPPIGWPRWAARPVAS